MTKSKDYQRDGSTKVRVISERDQEHSELCERPVNQLYLLDDGILFLQCRVAFDTEGWSLDRE